MAARLASRGIRDFVTIERGDDMGGVWRDNTYPGAACDIRSDVYSLSFAPNPNWSRSYSQQQEILEYLRHTADDLGLYEHTLFGHEFEKAVWDATDRRWHITTSQGELTARVLVSGHGPLINPVWPSIPGLDSFAGPRFYTARWDHSVDLAGKRVAVIGHLAALGDGVPRGRAQAGPSRICGERLAGVSHERPRRTRSSRSPSRITRNTAAANSAQPQSMTPSGPVPKKPATNGTYRIVHMITSAIPIATQNVGLLNW